MATRQRTTAVNNALRIAVQLALLAQNSRAGSENQLFFWREAAVTTVRALA
jgi:hypothetical protein